MRYIWSRFLIFFLCFEACAFMMYYNFGPCGIQALHTLRKIKVTAQSDIKKFYYQNEILRDEIKAWQEGSFLQEKFAREKLALQKENEVIYFR